MKGMLTLMAVGCNEMHITMMDSSEVLKHVDKVRELLKAGCFENLLLQNTYDNSLHKQLEHQFIGLGEHASMIPAMMLDRAKVAYTYREVVNIGDWLSRPGRLVTKTGKTITTTDLHKTIMRWNLPGTIESAEFLTVKDAVKTEGVELAHLYPRDDYYDRTPFEQVGVRSFMHYTKRSSGDTGARGTGENHFAAKVIVVDGLEYPTMESVAIAYNLPSGTINTRVNSGSDKWANWYYRDKERARSVTYILRHRNDPRFYIGYTTSPKIRFNVHLSKLLNNKHGTPKLQALANEIGAEGLYPEFVMEGSETECRAKEQELVTLYKDDPLLLNASMNTKSAITDRTQDPLVNQRRIEGLRRAVSTDEHRSKMSTSVRDAWAVPGRKEARSGGGNPFAKKVSLKGVVYGSVIEAVKARIPGYTDWVIRTSLKSGRLPELFFCDASGNKL